MDIPSLRPRLITFRVVEFNSSNAMRSGSSVQLEFSVTPAIELSLGVPFAPDGKFDALVRIGLNGRGTLESSPDQVIATFAARYEARFIYPPGTTEALLQPQFVQEPHQYMLSCQAYPLAISHFRRELLGMGFQVSDMPLGL